MVSTQDTYLTFLTNVDTKSNDYTTTVSSVTTTETVIPEQKISDKVACEIYKLPEYLPVPRSKELPKELYNDTEAFAEVALDYIAELLNYIRDTQYRINTSYSSYLKDCSL